MNCLAIATISLLASCAQADHLLTTTGTEQAAPSARRDAETFFQKRPSEVTTMKIRIDVDGATVMATLDNNSQAAKDFIALLPLTLTLNDYNATEKVSDLPRRLSTKGAPPGFDPSVGDIAYYAPWGNLAIFYKDFGYSSGLVKLGTIRGPMTRRNRWSGWNQPDLTPRQPMPWVDPGRAGGSPLPYRLLCALNLR